MKKQIEMGSSKKSGNYILIGVRWVARILGGLLATLVLFIVICHAFSEEGLPNPFKQPGGVQLEFAAMLAIWTGMIVGWKWEGIGGILAISGVIIFHIVEGTLWLNWLFGLLGLCGVLFLLCWCIKKLQTKGQLNDVS